MIQPVIMAGGIGTRLWPLSRAAMPKQYLALVNEQTLIQNTVQRCQVLTNTPPMIVCNEAHRFILKSQMVEIGCENSSIILEPEAKNTAPAIALAAHFALKNECDQPMLIMPADHDISDILPLKATLEQAEKAANSGLIVTFSITASRPETGFGYIRTGQPLSGYQGINQVEEFVEKPDLERAKMYIQASDMGWNSGIVMVKPIVYLAQLKRFAPKIAKAVQDAAHFTQDLCFYRPKKSALLNCPSDSIDYAILERSADVVVIPVALNWSDVGSFKALANYTDTETDKEQLLVESKDVFIKHQQGHLIATLGVKNTTIIHTQDATLVANEQYLEQLPNLLHKLSEHAPQFLQSHTHVFRPWGNYKILLAADGVCVKQLCIKPGHSLSLQRHQLRAEHWVVVSGTATIQLAQQETILHANESCYIAPKQWHRLWNKQTQELRIIEVQTGTVLCESDIERAEDDYGRV